MKQPTVYSSGWRFGLALSANVLVFSLSLATVLTILLFGLKIIGHGVPMCILLAQANLLDRVLYTSCGCALVELILLPFCILGVWFSGPKLFRQSLQLREWVRNRMKTGM